MAIKNPSDCTWLQYFVEHIRVDDTEAVCISRYLDVPFAMAEARGAAKAELAALIALRDAVGKYIDDGDDYSIAQWNEVLAAYQKCEATNDK